MKSKSAAVLLALLGFALLASQASAYTPVTHAELQDVLDGEALGESKWADEHSAYNTLYPTSIVGVVINNPWDMLNYATAGSESEWQTYFQALPGGTYGTGEDAVTIASGDFGGTAMYMVKCFDWGAPATSHYQDDPDPSYLCWQSEMDRLNYCDGTTAGEPLRYGDVVLIEANAPGMAYKGKFNINEQHKNDPARDFNITVLERNYTPAIAHVELSDLKSSDDTSFLFDVDRETGCEHYQASLVHLDGLLLDASSTWETDGTVTVHQGDLTFPLKLGLDSGIEMAIDPLTLQSVPFSITAILDQEAPKDPVTEITDYTSGYRLWMTNAEDLVLTGDANRDGSVNGTDLNAVLSNYNASTAATWAMGDFNGDGSINGTDLNTVLSSYNKSMGVPACTAAVPEPSVLVLIFIGFAVGVVWRRQLMISDL